MSRRGFTLIELLVVVTIIVVLLSLLAPAMDKAIYQAELALCAANQKAVVSGVITYAFDHKRQYPYREGVRTKGIGPAIIQMGRTQVNSITGAGWVYDERPMMAPYFDINGALSDPLTERVDREVQDETTTIHADYWLRFGWTWAFGFPGSSGMFKVGDRYSFDDNAVFYDGEPRRFRFTSLVQDRDQFIANTATISGHPDDEGVMHLLAFDNENIEQGYSGPAMRALELAQGRNVFTEWLNDVNNPTSDRGDIDTNYGYQDGSVERMSNLGPVRFPRDDPRITFVPLGGSAYQWGSQMARVPVK